jgi:hypothetical protein
MAQPRSKNTAAWDARKSEQIPSRRFIAFVVMSSPISKNG